MLSAQCKNQSFRRRDSLLIWFFLLLALGCRPQVSRVHEVEVNYNGYPLWLVMVAGDKDLAKIAGALAFAEVKRLEKSYSPLSTDGVLFRFNQDRRTRDPELYQLLQRGNEIATLTRGRYSHFMGFLERAYGFTELYPSPPSAQLIKDIMLPIRRAYLEFVPARSEVSTPDDAYSVSLTGVIDGYTVDQALAHLMLAGIGQAMVQYGNFYAWGPSRDGLGWEFEIRHPVTDSLISTLFVENTGAASMSIQDQVFLYRNDRYYNNLDPLTGLPARQMLSATVLAPTSEQASMLAKGVFTMPIVEGVQLLEQLAHVDGLLIGLDGRTWKTDSLMTWGQQ